MSQLHTTKIAEQPDIIMMLSLLLCEQLSNFVMCHFPVTANTFAYYISHYTYKSFFDLTCIKSVQVIVRLHIFLIIHFWQKCCHLLAEMKTYLTEMKISKKKCKGTITWMDFKNQRKYIENGLELSKVS